MILASQDEHLSQNGHGMPWNASISGPVAFHCLPTVSCHGLPARLSQAVDQIIEIPESCGGLCAICHEAQIETNRGRIISQ